RTRVIDLFEHLMKGDVAAALQEFRAQYDVGADPATVLTDLAEFNHLVTRMRFVPSAAEDASLSEEERRRGLEFSRSLSVRVLSRTGQMRLKGIGEVQASNRPLAAGEMVLIRMAHAASLPTLDEALKTLEDPTPGPDDGPAPRGSPPSGEGGGARSVAQMRSTSNGGGSTAMRLVERQEVAEPVKIQAQPPRPESETGPVVRSLADIAALADANRDLAFKVQLK